MIEILILDINYRKFPYLKAKIMMIKGIYHQFLGFPTLFDIESLQTYFILHDYYS